MPEPKRLNVPINPARALRDLSRSSSAVVPVDDEELNTTILQSDKPTDIQTNQETNLVTDRPADQQTDHNADKPTDNQQDKLTNKKPNNATKPVKQASALRIAPKPEAASEATSTRRADGRTMRVRQDTADRTLVTSLRLSVLTVEQLDEYCWRNRQRKQDVVQAALDLYFATMATEEG